MCNIPRCFRVNTKMKRASTRHSLDIVPFGKVFLILFQYLSLDNHGGAHKPTTASTVLPPPQRPEPALEILWTPGLTPTSSRSPAKKRSQTLQIAPSTLLHLLSRRYPIYGGIFEADEMELLGLSPEKNSSDPVAQRLPLHNSNPDFDPASGLLPPSDSE